MAHAPARSRTVAAAASVQRPGRLPYRELPPPGGGRRGGGRHDPRAPPALRASPMRQLAGRTRMAAGSPAVSGMIPAGTAGRGGPSAATRRVPGARPRRAGQHA